MKKNKIKSGNYRLDCLLRQVADYGGTVKQKHPNSSYDVWYGGQMFRFTPELKMIVGQVEVDISDQINIIHYLETYRKLNQTNFTYLAYDGRFYKIGRSDKPKERVKSMTTSNPTIKLLFYGKGETELFLHHKYRKQRIKGEWFDLTKEQEEEIRLLLVSNN